MTSKQKLSDKLRRLEEEITRLRIEIEESEAPGHSITLRGKFTGLKGLDYKEILDAKKVWPSSVK